LRKTFALERMFNPLDKEDGNPTGIKRNLGVGPPERAEAAEKNAGKKWRLKQNGSQGKRYFTHTLNCSARCTFVRMQEATAHWGQKKDDGASVQKQNRVTQICRSCRGGERQHKGGTKRKV